MEEQTLLGGRRKGGLFLLYFLVVLGLAALGMAVYHYYTGSEKVMPWQPAADLYPISTTFTRFTDLFQTFPVSITAFLVSERFDVGLPVIRPELAAIYLGILALALIVYFTIVSTFARLPYIVAMTLVMLFLATFNFDLLRVTKENAQFFLILVLAVLVIASYSFHAFFTKASLWLRFCSFSVIVIALTAFMGYRSQYVPVLSAMQVIHYSSLGAFVAAGLFIFLVAFENIHALLWINTQAPTPNRRFGLWHFILIGLLYLLNLLLLYLTNAGLIELDFYYVDAFIILLLSTIAGFWGWQRREVQYRQYFSFANGGSYLYLVLVINCFLCIGYAFATANTPLISAFTDLIVYTHLAYGFMFFLYILLNFYKLIQERLAVYKVVFDPKQVPFFTVYVMGTLLIMSLIFRSPLSIPNRAQAGHFNYLGDFYKAAGNPLLAERFYTEGTVFSHHNLKSTYALAGIYRERTYERAEINLLKDALEGKPNEKMYARMAATQTDKKDFFNHLFLLNQGLSSFPESAPLLNNKALLYETTTLVDSTEYFYREALRHAGKFEDLVQSNLLAFQVKSGNREQAVQMLQTKSEPGTYPAWVSNATVLNMLQEKSTVPGTAPDFPAKILDPAQFALFYHYTLHHINQANVAVLKRINLYLAQSENAPYAENLTLLKALAEYHSGQVKEARNTLENQALVSEGAAGFYYYLIGSWLLEQKLYAAAASYFDKARQANTPEAELPYLYALAHTPDKNTALSEALSATDNLKDPFEKARANFLADVLNLTNESVLTAPDSAKVAFLILYHPELTTPEFERITNAVQAGSLKAAAQRELATHYLQINNVPAANKTIQSALRAAAGNKNILADLNVVRANLLVKQGRFAELNQLIPSLASRRDQLFYQAVAAEKVTPKQAATYYNKIPQSLIYKEEALLAAANYFSRVQKNDNKAYDVLLAGIKYNPFSAALYQAYIFNSIKLGFIDFAATAAEELRSLLTSEEYSAFRSVYEQKVLEKQATVPGWD